MALAGWPVVSYVDLDAEPLDVARVARDEVGPVTVTPDGRGRRRCRSCRRRCR
jgi:hypothetical protein